MFEMKWNGQKIRSIGVCKCGAVQIEFENRSEIHTSLDYFNEHGGSGVDISEWFACNHCVNNAPIIYGFIEGEEDE
jgi:hypothetical protein